MNTPGGPAPRSGDRGAPLPLRTVWRYAALGGPLAMVALPLYVHLPRFWHQAYDLGLGGIGFALLAARALDALQDPLLGAWSDRLAAASPGGRSRMLAWSAPVTGAGLLAVFNAPSGWPAAGLWAWLLMSLVVCYFGFSALTIAYTALAADLHADAHQRTRLAGTREALGLVGVMVAAALPEWLARTLGPATAYRWFALGLVPALLVGAWISRGSASAGVMHRGRLPARAAAAAREPVPGTAPALPAAGSFAVDRVVRVLALLRRTWQPLRAGPLRALLLVNLFSGVAAAVPASLVLFFIQDVVARPDLAGAFLAAYFLAGALGMPAWIVLARRHGKARAWGLAMALAIGAFVWAFALGPGDAWPYLGVCVAAGLAFGGDLALPPSLLSDLADRSEGAQGAWFGLWALVGKLNLALGAGISLPLVSALGYQPGASAGPSAAHGRLVLSATYALLPCALKAVALVLLWLQRRRLDVRPA